MTTARRFVTRHVRIVDEQGQQMRGRVLLPMRPEVPKYHLLAESIGAFADDEGWEEFISVGSEPRRPLLGLVSICRVRNWSTKSTYQKTMHLLSYMSNIFISG